MIKIAVYTIYPTEGNHYKDISGVKTTTESLGRVSMRNCCVAECKEFFELDITNYVAGHDMYSYTGHNQKVTSNATLYGLQYLNTIIQTKNGKIQKISEFNPHNNKIFSVLLCKDGEVILAKKYDDQGNFIGSIKKVDKIN